MFSWGGCFDVLPEELIRHIYSYADIPSLAAMGQTGKSRPAQYAFDNYTWADLAERRFQFVANRTHPNSHGGYTWKEAYRTLSHCNRIPKCRYTSSRKVVFAKEQGGKNRKSQHPLSLWVLLGHTDNCETRTFHNSRSTSGGNYYNGVGEGDRYVELYLCMQNVKSAAGAVTVEVLDSAVTLMGRAGRSEQTVSRVHSTGPTRAKLLYHSRVELSSDEKSCGNFSIARGVVLQPFDFVVVSAHFSCARDVYETDFLTRAISVQVPVRTAAMRNERLCASLFQSTVSCATAFFMPESDVWNFYNELPGGCLTLTDRFRLPAM